MYVKNFLQEGWSGSETWEARQYLRLCMAPAGKQEGWSNAAKKIQTLREPLNPRAA
jgi:hypothetical protein